MRIGTAEIYRQEETEPAVKDSLVVGRQIDGDVEVVLLVVPADGAEMDDELVARLRSRIREGASPRHVPRHIVPVPDIPYTRSGKKVELAVARLINGAARSDNRDALANPQALAGGISEAMVATQFGLFIAVPGILAVVFLKRSAVRRQGEIQRKTGTLLSN